MTYNYIYDQFTAITLFYSVMAVLLAYLFSYCLSSGNIFDFYHEWIKKLPKKLYKWLGGCELCWSFTWVHIPIFVYRYYNTQLDLRHSVILFIWQYLIIFVGIKVIFYIDSITSIYKKRLENDNERIKLLQWRLWGEYQHNNPDTTNTTN